MSCDLYILAAKVFTVVALLLVSFLAAAGVCALSDRFRTGRDGQ